MTTNYKCFRKHSYKQTRESNAIKQVMMGGSHKLHVEFELQAWCSFVVKPSGPSQSLSVCELSLSLALQPTQGSTTRETLS